MNKMVKLVFMV